MSVKIKKTAQNSKQAEFASNEDGVTVNLAATKAVPIDPRKLVPYANNAKIHSYSQIQMLKAHFSEYGFDQPVVVDKNMVIIKGHGRTQAAIELGLDVIPVIVRDDLSETQVKAARIADNKVSSSEYDSELLNLEISELSQDIDALMLGYSEVEMQEILGAMDEMEEDTSFDDHDLDEKPQAVKESYAVLVRCNDEQHQLVVFEDLVSNGYDAKMMDKK